MTESVVEAARADGRTTLAEPEAKTLLEDIGLQVPSFCLVSTPEAAVEAADAIGYPVVVKVVSPAVQHKSEWADGVGVAVGLDDENAVRHAAARIADALDHRGLDGDLLVESAADTAAGTELLLGGTRHPSFGPTVTLGLGGVYAEAFEDVAHRLAPVTRPEVRGMLDEFAGARLLDGLRGRPAADVEAAVDAVVAVGDLLVDEPAIEEIDVNPLLATAEGAAALDALVVLADVD